MIVESPVWVYRGEEGVGEEVETVMAVMANPAPIWL
jgi:hypothetical protein